MPSADQNSSQTDIEAPYLLDANAWIQAWDRYYPDGVFVQLWAQLRRAIIEGIIILPTQIAEELIQKANGLDSWILGVEENWTPHTESIESRNAEIIGRFRGLVYKGRKAPRSIADATLISTAIEVNGSVISHEKYRVQGERPTVTGVCDAYGVPWAQNLARVFTKLGWRY